MKKILISLLCFLAFCGCLDAQNLQKNIAYEDANVRFTVISDGVIRMEYAPDARWTGLTATCRRRDM